MLDGYLPGYKWGGPVRTVANIVDSLSDRLAFWIVTRDRDETDSAPYPDVRVDAWNRLGQAMVYYASPGSLSYRTIRRLVNMAAPDIVYLNGFFSVFTIRFLVLRRLHLVRDTPVVLAPRGEFSPGALQVKRRKKRAYIALARCLGLYAGLIWQASSSLEEREIRSGWGNDITVCVAPDLIAMETAVMERRHARPPKHPGAVRFVFLSRITHKKNLLFALQVVRIMKGDVVFDIYGHVESARYWKLCQELISSMPGNIHVSYRGALPHDMVQSTLSGYHFFLFPTHGENFGHVIVEAWSAGCPVLISDQTPWCGLADKGIGWDIPLSDVERWVGAVHACSEMQNGEYQQLAMQAQRFAEDCFESSDAHDQNIALFENALRKPV